MGRLTKLLKAVLRIGNRPVGRSCPQELKKAAPQRAAFFAWCTPGRGRTGNLGLTKLLLCPLSYGGEMIFSWVSRLAMSAVRWSPKYWGAPEPWRQPRFKSACPLRARELLISSQCTALGKGVDPASRVHERLILDEFGKH